MDFGRDPTELIDAFAAAREREANGALLAVRTGSGETSAAIHETVSCALRERPGWPGPRRGRPARSSRRTCGTAGLVAFPYFLAYEVLGPWFEAEGHLVFAVSFSIAEHQREYFPAKDRLLLVL